MGNNVNEVQKGNIMTERILPRKTRPVGKTKRKKVDASQPPYYDGSDLEQEVQPYERQKPSGHKA